jgi:hypothetical protein
MTGLARGSIAGRQDRVQSQGGEKARIPARRQLPPKETLEKNLRANLDKSGRRLEEFPKMELKIQIVTTF